MRSGIFYFSLLLLFLQVLQYVLNKNYLSGRHFNLVLDKPTQRWIDSCKSANTKSLEGYKFNPNKLSEKQAYLLGLSPNGLRVLDSFIQSGKRYYDINALKADLQLSDSLAFLLQSKLRFPRKSNSKITSNAPPQIISCLNRASAQQLTYVRGVGPVLSQRIIKFRDALGGFQRIDQLLDIYGLNPEVVRSIAAFFPVVNKPVPVKINLNEASRFELVKFVYFRMEEADKILEYREIHGAFKSTLELAGVLGWSRDKIDRIALYLAL
ncbi:MAG: hypothetical protein RLZZ241_2259 [Bacteroidota bacterium]